MSLYNQMDTVIIDQDQELIERARQGNGWR